jgi:hypothetical protein
MVEEATVDCYNEEEQATGLFTMIEENLTVPFETRVLGVSATVTGLDLTDSIQIVATCCSDGLRQAIPILDLPCRHPHQRAQNGSRPTVAGTAEHLRARQRVKAASHPAARLRRHLSAHEEHPDQPV